MDVQIVVKEVSKSDKNLPEKSATQSQIKTAYYKQSFIYHPDKNPGKGIFTDILYYNEYLGVSSYK
uniref:J domain-containing protein n=1 Tax=Seriola lalandi dorsalis TaxID=1841481 RepID=A0A3B4YU40_SERLL